MRLFLAAAWTDDADRCEEAGVPKAARAAQSKPAIALAEIDRVREAGLRFSCVLADAGFGSSPAFRQGLDERELAWAAGIACTQLVYPTTVKLRPAYTPSGRPAKHPLPNRPPRSAAEMLETQRWRRITWRTGTKGPLNARFAAVRVRIADGPLNAEGTRLPGEELWLIGEWRDSGETKYYLSTLCGRPPVSIANCSTPALRSNVGLCIAAQRTYVDGPPCQLPIAAPQRYAVTSGYALRHSALQSGRRTSTGRSVPA